MGRLKEVYKKPTTKLTYKIQVIETLEIQEWTIEGMLSVINENRSSGWTDYTEEDFLEGWNEWIEGEFYALIENKERYFIDTIKEGTVINSFWKVDEEGRIYLWSAFERWEYAVNTNKNKEGFYNEVKKNKGFKETNRQLVHKFLGTV